jgi:hypothetical protein
MKKIFLMIVLFMLPAIGFAQEYLTIGNTSSTSNQAYVPFYRYYDNSAASALYLSSELGDAKTLTHIAFDTYQNANISFSNVRIYVRHTSATSLSTPYTYSTSDYTLVYDDEYANSSTGWNEVELETQFEYNGTDNLQFLFIKDYESYEYPYPSWRSTSTSFTSTLYRYADGSGNMPTSLTSSSTIRPNIRFQYIAGPDIKVSSISLPAEPYYAGNYDVSTTIKWLAGSDCEYFTLHWSYDGDYQGSIDWNGTLNETNNSVTIDLGSVDFGYPADEYYYLPHYVKVWVDNINGEDEDMDPDNNALTKNSTPVLDDIGISEIVEPRGNVSLGDQDIIVTLHNYGARKLTSAQIHWSIDGVNQTPFEWTGELPYTESVDVNLGSYYFSTKVPLAPYVISSWTALSGDEYRDNDVAPVSTVGPPIVPDTYVIGGDDGFKTLEELNAYIASSGISGEGTYNFVFRPGVYTDPLEVPMSEVNEDYSFVFKSANCNPNDVKIRVTGTGTSDALVKLINMNNIEFCGITFEMPSGMGTAIEMNNCNYIEIRNCVFNYGSKGIVQNYDGDDTRSFKVSNCQFNDLSEQGIVQNYGAFGDYNYTYIEENEFTGMNVQMENPIYVTNGSKIRYNHFKDLQPDYTAGDRNVLISVSGTGNDTEIDSNTTLRVQNYSGIQIVDAMSGKIMKNNLQIYGDGDYHALHIAGSELETYRNNFVMSGTGAVVKIERSKGVFSNNMLSGYTANSGLELYDNDGIYVIYNSVQNDSKNDATVIEDEDNAMLYRNIFSSLGDAPVISMMNSDGSFIDQNTYYAGSENFAKYNGQTFADLESWQGISGQDANTNVVKPAFKNVDNLHLVRVLNELIIEDPVNLEMDETERMMYENTDYNGDYRGNQNEYYKGADAVTPEITIIDNPRDVLTCEGDTTVMLAVTATVTYNADIQYQWYLDNEIIEGATNALYTFDEGVTYKHSGYYSCELSVRGGEAPLMSNTSAVYILTAPEIVKQNYENKTQGTEDRYALTGDIVHLTVETHMRGITPPFYKDKYQWYFYIADEDRSVMLDNVNPRFSGAESSELVISGVNADDLEDGNYYYVIVEGLCGSVTSHPYDISEAPEYYITFNNQPVPQDVCEGANTQFTIVAQASEDVESIEYQWYKDDMKVEDNARISGATTNQLLITNINYGDMGDYHLSATTVPGAETFTTNKAGLTVNPTPEITQDIAEDTLKVEINTNLTITIEANDADSYQWFKDYNPMAGETDATLDILIDDENMAGEYYVVVSNNCGDVQSKIVWVEVMPEGWVSVNETTSDGYGLYTAEPNPVSSASTIKFRMATTQHAELFVTDAYGQRVATIFDGIATTGINKAEFNADALELSSGVYYYTLVTSGKRITNKLVIVK